MAENCGQEKDVWPISPLEGDVNNWLDSPLPCSYYGLLCLCQVNAACMLNALTAKELSFTTTCMDVKIYKNCKAERKIRVCKSRERGLCMNKANRESQKCSYMATKSKQHLLALLSGAPGVLSHCYCLPWQKYIVTASSFWAHCRAITFRKEKTPLPSRSADWTTQGQLHSSLLPSWHLQEGHCRPCLTWQSTGISGDGTRCAIIWAQTPSVLFHPTSKPPRALQPCLRQQQCFTYQSYW